MLVRRPDGVEMTGSEPKDVEATKGVIREWYPDCEFEVLDATKSSAWMP